jgi:hypothetical protein
MSLQKITYYVQDTHTSEFEHFTRGPVSFDQKLSQFDSLQSDAGLLKDMVADWIAVPVYPERSRLLGRQMCRRRSRLRNPYRMKLPAT